MKLKRIFLSIFLISCVNLCFPQEKKFKVAVEPTFQELLAVADTDNDKKITIEDDQNVLFWLYSISGDSVKLKKTYFLSNLLQELSVARKDKKDSIVISLFRIKEPPAFRISRRIEDVFWDDLTRTIDSAGIIQILQDEKTEGKIQRLYVPFDDINAQEYYQNLQEEINGFQVIILPKKITPEYVRSINDEPGLLSLKIKDGKGVPFVVPGGRFNEMYGWDSYFIGVGLILDDKTELAKAMVDNFVYQINHYGKILNANRTYYLTRSQPPFLSSFIRKVYASMEEKDIIWLKNALSAAIKEYEQVWMEPGVKLTETGLSRYFGEGIGIPTETEKGHFEEILGKYAKKYKLPVEEFRQKYTFGELKVPELDRYFMHDRAMRESGHDTSWRLVNKAAFLNPVGLNSLLYKYEKDFQYLINEYFGGDFVSDSGKEYSAQYWAEKAESRKELMNKYFWNAEKGSFYDYNFKKGERTDFISATNFYPLWAGLASEEQAEKMVENLMQDLKATGGILSTAKISAERSAENEVQRQWDYPFGWAPHQMLLWNGLLNYGYDAEAQELIYRWLWMITKNAVNYNGTIPEKYDVANATHKVYAEYGNVGTDFDYITTSGFGWMNASYQLGLELLKPELVKKLNELVPPEKIF